ncbi:hypothetical protein HJC99_01920 [Candidatus Saccharibacteria bacterium]|nr:hypothetical protein [Candidatus Saccharibacteria bacterium]
MLKTLRSFFCSERGDTLVEVTFALGIMATVLISATLVGVRALNLGRSARERVQLVNVATAQAEALRSFRDNTLWNQFVAGGTVGALHFTGVTNTLGSSCRLPSLAGQSCYHIAVQSGLFVPVSGSVTGGVSGIPGGAFIEIPLSSASSCSSVMGVHYGVPSVGAGPWQEGVIIVKLVNLNYTGVASAC